MDKKIFCYATELHREVDLSASRGREISIVRKIYLHHEGILRIWQWFYMLLQYIVMQLYVFVDIYGILLMFLYPGVVCLVVYCKWADTRV